MSNINEFTFWKASCVQNPKNCIYPTKVIVTDVASFNEMAHFDHVGAEYENCYRGNDTFIASDVQSGDVSFRYTVPWLDTDNISSKRRNPVIADVFSRMNYMERRGSGFKKIKEDYHNAVNYRPLYGTRYHGPTVGMTRRRCQRGRFSMTL